MKDRDICVIPMEHDIKKRTASTIIMVDTFARYIRALRVIGSDRRHALYGHVV